MNKKGAGKGEGSDNRSVWKGRGEGSSAVVILSGKILQGVRHKELLIRRNCDMRLKHTLPTIDVDCNYKKDSIHQFHLCLPLLKLAKFFDRIQHHKTPA